MLGDKGLIYSAETDTQLPAHLDNVLVKLQNNKLKIKYSFIKERVVYNYTKFKDSVKNMVVTSLILKYLKIMTMPIKSKENTANIRRFKKYIQSSTSNNSILSERFSEILKSFIKDIYKQSPFTLYCCFPFSSKGYMLQHSLLNPIKQWDKNGFAEFTYSEFLSEFQTLLHKSLPENVNK